MRALATAASFLDAAGLRRLVALVATGFYYIRTRGKQRFKVDGAGRWVNLQPRATVVSPNIHTTSYESYYNWVIHHWANQYLPQLGDTVVDVGGGVGEEAIIFSKLVGPSGRVISIEAHPETFQCLAESVRKSNLTNVQTVNAAIADRDGTTVIANSDNHLTSSIMLGRGGLEVPMLTLDSVADQLGVQRINLLKMNIEGAESSALRGGAQFLSRTDNVCISCHDFLADRNGEQSLRTKDEVIAILKSHKFLLSTRDHHELPWVRDYVYGRKPD